MPKIIMRVLLSLNFKSAQLKCNDQQFSHKYAIYFYKMCSTYYILVNYLHYITGNKRN